MVQCRLISQIGKRYEFDQYWYSEDNVFHIEEISISKEQYETKSFEDFQKEFGTPKKCDRCNAEYKGEQLKPSTGKRPVYDTEDGTNNHPGDMFFAPWMHTEKDGVIHCMYWDNCKDPRGHLMVVLPNGHTFDTDSRASNCNKKDDKTHRCWEKKGETPKITIGGPSSDNGVGSIGMTDWHGYLTEGKLHT